MKNRVEQGAVNFEADVVFDEPETLLRRTNGESAPWLGPAGVPNTKRSARLRELDGVIDWPANVWMGVSAESARYTFRIDDLRRTSAAVKCLSLEPLLGPLPALDLRGIQWVIVGGESGPGCRPMDAEWVRDIREQCAVASVPFFFKQWGGVRKKGTGRELDGQTYDAMPRSSQGIEYA